MKRANSSPTLQQQGANMGGSWGNPMHGGPGAGYEQLPMAASQQRGFRYSADVVGDMSLPMHVDSAKGMQQPAGGCWPAGAASGQMLGQSYAAGSMAQGAGGSFGAGAASPFSMYGGEGSYAMPPASPFSAYGGEASYSMPPPAVGSLPPYAVHQHSSSHSHLPSGQGAPLSFTHLPHAQSLGMLPSQGPLSTFGVDESMAPRRTSGGGGLQRGASLPVLQVRPPPTQWHCCWQGPHD
jgi:hypothetical protein